jgi:hypothetical protein
MDRAPSLHGWNQFGHGGTNIYLPRTGNEIWSFGPPVCNCSHCTDWAMKTVIYIGKVWKKEAKREITTEERTAERKTGTKRRQKSMERHCSYSSHTPVWVASEWYRYFTEDTKYAFYLGRWTP